jgi:hypothetical protein
MWVRGFVDSTRCLLVAGSRSQYKLFPTTFSFLVLYFPPGSLFCFITCREITLMTPHLAEHTC